ncbi:MAG: hypothetical protein JWP87_3533 [Labilithrix sp.]|nr:hypothetical protein [Labilithrix sp.]
MIGSRRTLGILAFLAAAGVFAIACGGDDSGGDLVEEADAGNDAPTFDTSAPDTSTPDTSVPDTSMPDAADAADANVGMNLDGGACDGGTVAATSITPKFGVTTDKTTLTVSGSGFLATPKLYLKSGATLTPLTSVAFLSSTSVSGTVPSGVAAGTYDVVVVNPGDCAAVLAGSFKVVADPAPVVLTVSPESGTTQNDVAVTITGCNFATDGTAKLATVSATLVETLQVNVTPTVLNAADAACGGSPSYTMTGTINSKALAVGAYLVRVKNTTAGTFGDYASFVVSNPTGNPTGGWKAGPALNTGRRSLGVVAGRIDDARRFLYAVGGEAADGTALKTIEVAPVDRFGQLGTWTIGRNELTTPRSGLTVVRQGSYVYAIGGTSTKGGTGGATPAGTALSTIERAKILDLGGAPKITDPNVLATGTLPKGTFYYKVAAVLTSAVPATAGETLPSDEAVATLAATGSVALTWAAPADGTVDHYRVYRTKAADGASGAEVLLKDNIPPGTLTYTDTGADAPGTITPLVFGETGPWIDAGQALFKARLDTAAAIVPDPTGALFVEVAGGWGTCVATLGIMDCTEKSSISADGATLGAFVANTPLSRPRMRHGLAVMTAKNGPPSFTANATANTAFLVAAGGKGINTGANTVEATLVGATGVLGAWANPNGGAASGGGFANQRDGIQLLISSGYGYALFGGSATVDQSSQAAVTATSISFANWSNASANLATPLGRYGAAAESAYFYVAGGTTNDTDALATVYSILH